jgi:hypothetical protein
MMGIYQQTKQLLASQEGLCSMELVCVNIGKMPLRGKDSIIPNP